MNEPRYSEDEVAEIFRLASELEQRDPPVVGARYGMTLAELQEIGREAGLDPELIARAATAPQARAVANQRVVGLPVGVGRTVDLGRAMDDAEWDRLVVDLRETFDARGVVRVDGTLRQWSNGNLQVLVEPVASGHRVRFKTVNANARAFMGIGVAFIGLFVVLGVVGVATDGLGLATAFGRMAGIAAIGTGFFG